MIEIGATALHVHQAYQASVSPIAYVLVICCEFSELYGSDIYYNASDISPIAFKTNPSLTMATSTQLDFDLDVPGTERLVDGF